jgi:Protein of unknown function (DUF3108)
VIRLRGHTVVLVALAAPALTAQTRDSTSDAAAPDPRSWVGERLEYDAKWGVLPLGTAELLVAGLDTVRGDSAIHIRFLIKGGARLYRLNNEWDSWVGLSDFTSRRFIQDHDEGGKKYRNAYEIFPDSGYYRQEGVDTVAATSALPLDDAAFFYFVRFVDLPPGRHEFDRYFKPDRNPVVLEVVGRDTLDVPAGRFDCLVVQPIIKGGGIFRERADGRLWITNDERRLLVQIRGKIAFATITMRLRKLTPATPAADPP